MNLDDLAQEIEDRNATLIACNVCLNCMIEKYVGGYIFIDYKIGESDRIAVGVCRKCFDKLDPNLIIQNMLTSMAAQIKNQFQS